MYLGYDYPKYRYPSYAPWCTPAGVAADVQYIPQPREVPQAREAIYPSALPSTAGTIPVAVATSITGWYWPYDGIFLSRYWPMNEDVMIAAIKATKS